MRAINIIKKTIEDLSIDISNQVVLTEVGSNNYIYTPIIASLCGVKKVYAVAKTNSYGNAEEIISIAQEICNRLNIKNVIFLKSDEVSSEILSEADIITNSGNLRPLDSNKLKNLKKSAVIPLMFEAWEFRKEDLDLDYCNANNIKVAGTWENHPKLKVFDYSGLLALKMAFDAGFEVLGNKIMVWSDDHFGETIKNKFLNEGAEVILTNDTDVFYNELTELDFIFICDYDEERNYFGNDDSIFDLNIILEKNPAIGIVHLYGNIDFKLLNNKGLKVSPQKNGYSKIMTHTLGYVGLIPILKLQIAGFRVAQEMINNSISDISQPLYKLN